MGMADFCSFVGAYLPRIREMRLVRRESGRNACMVLLRFTDSTSTDEFYLDFNNKPVRLCIEVASTSAPPKGFG
jgi:BRCA1-associated protein